MGYQQLFSLQVIVCRLDWSDLQGISVPDQTIAFSKLTAYLRTQGIRIAILHSKNCFSLQAAIDSTVKQFLRDDPHYYHYSKFDMSVLAEWYKQLMTKEPLVILLQDFECFNNEILCDIITICRYRGGYLTDSNSHYRNSGIPFTLIAGLSISVESFHKLLPQSVNSLLNLEKFYLQPCNHFLTRIIEAVSNYISPLDSWQLVIDPVLPIGLSPGTFTFLVENFNLQNFSVHNFIQKLKVK